MPTEPDFVRQYRESGWRRDSMPLLEFLRKTTDAGDIIGWLKKAHQAAVLDEAKSAYEALGGARFDKAVAKRCGPRAWRLFLTENEGADFRGFVLAKTNEQLDEEERPLIGEDEREWNTPKLERFANDYVVAGEKVVAVDTVLRVHDKFYAQWAAMHIPFRTWDDLRDAEVERLVPAEHRHFATAMRLCERYDVVPANLRDFWTRPDAVAAEMRLEGRSQDHIEDVLAMVAGEAALARGYLAEEYAPGDAAPAEGGGRERREGAPREERFRLNPKQRQLKRLVEKRLDWALAANHADNEAAQDEARERAWRESTPLICEGRPGTGKTTVVLDVARRAAAKGAQVLLTVLTAKHATRLRAATAGIEGIVVDTCHAAFRFDQPEVDSMTSMLMYDLVVVDEFSLLTRQHFETLMRAWSTAEKIPAFVVLGDRYQLPGFGTERPWHSPAWRGCTRIQLHELYRCRDERFAEILDKLRVSVPKKRLVRELCRGRKAWDGYAPDVGDVARLLAGRPNTTFLTCTRRAEQKLNELAVQALFGEREPMATIAGDVEQNPENFENGALRSDRRPRAHYVDLHPGLKLVLTQNVRKADDFVNGMVCTVETFEPNAYGGVIRVLTETGQRVPVTMWTDKEKGNVKYFPVRVGYANTIHKAQGGEYEHVTIWLDTRFMPAAAYTALSRVGTMDSFLLGGALEKHHFVPATYAHPASAA